MGLETPVNYIDDLNINNPNGDIDPKSQGDDHIKNIKKALKQTFPSLNHADFLVVSHGTGSLVLTVNDNRKVFIVSVNCTIILPDSSTLPDGWNIVCLDLNSAGVTLSGNSNIIGGNDVSNHVLPPKRFCSVYKTGSTYYVDDLVNIDGGTY